MTQTPLYVVSDTHRSYICTMPDDTGESIIATIHGNDDEPEYGASYHGDAHKMMAAEIVRACNCHDEMLEALETLCKQEDWEGEDINPDSPIGKARTAIKKARGVK